MRFLSALRTSSPWRRAALAGAALAFSAAAQAGGIYHQTNLVSDGTIPALHTDPNLQNAWGIAFNPTGAVWVANNHTGLSTLYDGLGNPQSLVVSVPGIGGAAGTPTGIVFSGSSDFVVHEPGGASGAARFIFATENGTIAAWSPAVPPPAPSTHAFTVVGSHNNAVYKGLALGSSANGNFLYTTDFHNNRIEAYNGAFADAHLPGALSDPNLPAGYAPFGAEVIGSQLFVTYALRDAGGEDDVPGAGHGFVDVYDLSGNLLRRFASGGALNSPWGIAQAPANFGVFSNAILIGNFGDGHINAFDPNTGNLLGAISDEQGHPLAIDGLWGLRFGNGVSNQPTNSLFFSAGPDGEAHGLYGAISVAPEPASALGLAMIVLLARRRA